MNPEEFQRQLNEATDQILINQLKIQQMIFTEDLNRDTTYICTAAREHGLGIEPGDYCFAGADLIVPYLRRYVERQAEPSLMKPMKLQDVEGFKFEVVKAITE